METSITLRESENLAKCKRRKWPREERGCVLEVGALSFHCIYLINVTSIEVGEKTLIGFSAAGCSNGLAKFVVLSLRENVRSSADARLQQKQNYSQ